MLQLRLASCQTLTMTDENWDAAGAPISVNATGDVQLQINSDKRYAVALGMGFEGLYDYNCSSGLPTRTDQCIQEGCLQVAGTVLSQASQMCGA